MNELTNNNLDFNEAISSGSNTSFWTDTFAIDYSNPVTESFHTEILVVGAGIAGMSVAYELCKRGKQVAVVDDGSIGGGESGRTSAHLVTCLDDRYYKLKKIFGEEGSRLAAESHGMAINKVQSIVNHEGINCDYKKVNGYLFSDEDENEVLEKELKASLAAGIDAEMVNEIPGMLTGKRKGLKYGGQAEFHILKYLDGLKEAILEAGGKIYTGSHVDKVEKDSVILDKGYGIHFKHLVLCTNAPIDDRIKFPVKQYPFRSYVVAGLIKKGAVPHCLYWDTGNKQENNDISPYHFVRVSDYNNEYDLLISGGEDHPVADTCYAGDENERYDAIEKWTRKHYPLENVLYRWSGQIMETMDCLGYIGKAPIKDENIYVITGDTGNGITNALIGASIIPDLIEGKENPYAKLYDPHRFKFLTSGMVALKEGIRNVVKNIKNKAVYKSLADIKQLNPGKGFIIETESGLFGVTRDNAQKLHYVNGKCTLKEAVLIWNPDEKSWECPLHGCRYMYNGTVINGPTVKPLQYSSINQPIRGLV